MEQVITFLEQIAAHFHNCRTGNFVQEMMPVLGSLMDFALSTPDHCRRLLLPGQVAIAVTMLAMYVFRMSTFAAHS